MKALPEEFDSRAIGSSLAEHWDFEAATVEYAPVGAGSYHWVVADAAGRRAFVTVDDLDRKPWLGETREAAFDGLARAFETAVALREGGLDFVVSPLRTGAGETAWRITPRYSVALFPFVAADPRDEDAFFYYETAEDRLGVLALLAELHRATPTVAALARRVELGIAGRGRLESALDKLDETWRSGPFAEPAREVVARHRADVVDLLALLDRLGEEVARTSSDWVVTHGEPHARNVMRAGDGPRLIDWDTVALAPPERDLWMLVGDGTDPESDYSETTGHRPDELAVAFFRLAWDLDDLASYLDVLRSPHECSEDTLRALEVVRACIASRDKWANLLDSR